jgi:hypothetical protein
MFKVTPGPVSYFDVDDTLVMWPSSNKELTEVTTPIIDIVCRGKMSRLFVNTFNVDLLKNMSSRGHAIVVWSAGGSDWAEAVVIALGLQDYVDVVTAKPTYYIDDIKNPAEILGKYGYFDIHGNRIGSDHYSKKEEP